MSDYIREIFTEYALAVGAPLKVRRGISVLLIIFFFSDCASYQEIVVPDEQRQSDKKIIADYGIICDPLTLEDVINIGFGKIGAYDNLRFHANETFRKIRHRELLQAELNSLEPEDANADMAHISDILEHMMTYGVYKQSETKECFFERHRVRLAQRLALDIAESYWKAIFAEDHLDHVRWVKKNMPADRTYPQQEWMINQLGTSLFYLGKELTRQIGLREDWQYGLARFPAKSFADTLPDAGRLRTERIEEYALEHRLGLDDNELSDRKDEVPKAFRELFPEVGPAFIPDDEDNRQLIGKWGRIGKELGEYLLRFFSDIGSNMKEKSEESRFVQMMATGIITQVRISVLNYADKKKRYEELDKTYADHMKISQEKDIGETGKKSELHPEVRAAVYNPEIIAVRLLRDDAIADMLIAYNRLLADMGVPPLEWGKYKFEKEFPEN